ncbi:MAG TPA: hypothetical protein VER96_15630 [Polyangiaceae bacterium]|nr:hypothetical protein [Polyangiaceae bacterium]
MSLSRFCSSLAVFGMALFASPLCAQTTPHGPIAPEAPRLNDAAELARVVSLYEAGKYGECADSLSHLLNGESAHPFRDPDVIENARIYHAACLIGIGQTKLADEPLRAAIRQNPQMKPPDSLLFPPQVIDRFLRVRQTMFDVIKKAEDDRIKRAQEVAAQQEARAKRERERVAALERLAQQETVSTPHSRWLAMVPFGVGQFQNGDKPLGYVFLTSEVVLAATTLTALGVETHLVLATSQLDKPDPSNNTRNQNWKTALEYSSYAWIGVSLIGIIEAQISFVPEQRQIKKRDLPPRLRPETSSFRVVPNAAPVNGGAVFGLSGRF